MIEVEKMDLRSMDITKDKTEHLKRIFPEVVTEGKVDFERLRQVLGDEVETGHERYGLNWAGKSEVMKIIQKPSIGTLKPCKEESVDFDNTENLFIEGDNLEVLKLLQKSYYGKVKMIYIDPPYNTGNDFIYPDNYSETLETYLEYTGQADSEGRKFTTNPETDGRFHTKWIRMMYPRLYLARNLLTTDGVIFISIDDNEVKNLRFIMDEIFGEENFLCQFVWKRRTGSNDAKNNVSIDHDYVVTYTKSEFNKIIGITKDFSNYKNPDNDPRGPWARDNLTCGKTASQRPNLYYPITDPKTGITYECSPNRVWAYEKERMNRIIDEGKVLFPKNGKGTPMYKRHLSEVRSDTKPFSSIIKTVINTVATKETREIIGGQYFDHPKSVDLIQQLIQQGATDESIILDFFAGSATTAHAVLDLNQEDGGNRKFIMVQLPEPTDENSEAYKAGYKTIADIGKERIRRVIDKIKKENEGKLDFDKSKQDLGFKVFSLDESNFKIWEGENTGNEDELTKQLELHIDHINPESSQEDILFELLLKAGFKLTTKIEKIQIEGKDVFSVADGALFICLEKDLTKELLKEMAEKSPVQVICLDEGFRENDQLKTNAVQIMKSKDIEFRTV